MLIPLIANGPLKGPPPTPIAGHGAAQDPASQTAKQDTKDTFGALFREGDMAKKTPQPEKAQETGTPADGETPEGEVEIEGGADQGLDIETEPDLPPEMIAGGTGDQEDAPRRAKSTESDPGKQVAPNPDTVENISPLLAASARLPQDVSGQRSVDGNTLALNLGLKDATEANKVIAKENTVPHQGGPAAPARDGNLAALPTSPMAQTPVEAAKAQPLSASVAAIITKTAEDSTNASKRAQASLLSESAAVERALDQAVKADRLTTPGTPVNPPNAPVFLPRQHVDPAQLAKSLTTEVEVSALDDKPIAFEARTLGASSAAMAVPTQALAQRADLPQHIAMQIAAAAQRGGAGRPIDIVLNPAELGPVRLSLASADGVMSMTVIAERPETLDLMRRHIDTLAQEFLNIGYGKAQFSFGGGQSGQTGQEHSDTSHSLAGGSGPQAPITETPNLHHTPILISDRLDIRL